MTRNDVHGDVVAGEDTGQGTDGPSSARRRRGASTVLVAVVSLAVGIGVTVALTGRAGPDVPEPVGEGLDVAAPDAADVPELTGTAAPGRPADSPEAAVRDFLDAEMSGDFAGSYLLLSAADRDEYHTPAGWVATHADVMPPVTGFEVEDVAVDGSRAAVVTPITFHPSLDSAVGLVPERARATWVVVAEEGGWSVALGEAAFEPQYPPEQEAVAAVRSWARSHQDCDPAGEHSTVLGVRALAEQLCGTDGEVQVGPVQRFREGFDTNSFLAAYGEPVLEWARTVPVAGPVELRAVVAPVGQQWLVIGVLDSGTP